VRVLGHRQTKEAATDNPHLMSPRHIPTLQITKSSRMAGCGRRQSLSGHLSYPQIAGYQYFQISLGALFIRRPATLTAKLRTLGFSLADPPLKTRWSAVSIKVTGASCAAARALTGQRFLSTQAPRLPLPDCAIPATCRCSYQKFDDRRDEPRRAEDAGGARGSRQPGTERRSSRGRRSTDK